MEQYEKERPTLEAMALWDYGYLMKQEAILGKGRQGHCRKLRPWRWESALGRSPCGPDWRSAAQDRAGWQRLLDGLVEWRTRSRF
eukprot:7202876-Lingulodinium_polyedra.AAC.1